MDKLVKEWEGCKCMQLGARDGHCGQMFCKSIASSALSLTVAEKAILGALKTRLGEVHVNLCLTFKSCLCFWMVVREEI